MAHLKTCIKCHTEKLKDCYENDSHSKDGLRSVCRVCRNRQRRALYAKNRKTGKRRPRNWKKEAEYAKGNRRRHVAKYLIQSAKQRANKKGLVFNLDLHEAELIVRAKPMRCELSGITLKMAHGMRDYDSISLDRILPEKGYTIENVRIVCWAINAAAGTWGLGKVMEIFKNIKEV